MRRRTGNTLPKGLPQAGRSRGAIAKPLGIVSLLVWLVSAGGPSRAEARTAGREIQGPKARLGAPSAQDPSPDPLHSAEEFEIAMGRFWDRHGYRSFTRNVGDYLRGSPIFRAEPHVSKDRRTPRATLLRFAAYAENRRKDVLPLISALECYSHLAASVKTNPPQVSGDQETRQGLRGALLAACRVGQSDAARRTALARQRTLLAMHHSVLCWLDLEYALIRQDCRLALDRPDVLFERPGDSSWHVADSPGVFSLLVRGPDIEVLERIGRRLLSYTVNDAPDNVPGLLPDRAAFLQQVLAAPEMRQISNPVRRCITLSCRNQYEILYWDYVLGLFEAHPDGAKLLVRVFGAAARHGANSACELYWRLRECAFPGNSECIWPRKKMSRFDPRIFAIAQHARGRDVVTEMANVQHEIRERVKRGQLRGGGIAEYTKGRLHGMGDFLDYGVGGCEAFSSFVTTPLLALGHSGVHPVFIARPYQPWRHWIAGVEALGTLYICDAEAANFGPPLPLKQNLDRTMRTASAKDNRYLNMRVYSQTLASWEWEDLYEGTASVFNIRKMVNPLYAAYRQSVNRALRLH